MASTDMVRHGRCQSKPSKYAIEKIFAGEAETLIWVPQLEMQPFCPAAAVPGAPVVEVDGVQNSVVVPHWPQMSQHALSGHSFNKVRFVPGGAIAVLLTWGPQTAFGTV